MVFECHLSSAHFFFCSFLRFTSSFACEVIQKFWTELKRFYIILRKAACCARSCPLCLPNHPRNDYLMTASLGHHRHVTAAIRFLYYLRPALSLVPSFLSLIFCIDRSFCVRYLPSISFFELSLATIVCLPLGVIVCWGYCVD